VPATKRIDPRHWRPLFDAVYEMNTARDHADFVSGVAAAMSRLIPADFCHIHVVDRASGRLLLHAHPANPFNAEETAYYVAHSQEDPLVNHFERTGEKRARRLSDVVNVARFRRTEFYRRCHRRLGLKHTLALPISVNAHTVAALAFDRRERDFTRRHCALLDAFAPHFLLAWQRHENPWREAATPQPSARQRLRSLGLTPREADVLFWMTEGKQNREIAAILGRSLETIQEHVANLVRKLGQENRHATTVFALRHMQPR
jgi:DNA-binding CsgD family transcriptional regulator